MVKFRFDPLKSCNEITNLKNKPGLYIWGFENPNQPFKPYYVGEALKLKDRLNKELLLHIEKGKSSKDKFLVTLHKKDFFENPMKAFVFIRNANPGKNGIGITKDDYKDLVFYNNSDFLTERYFESIKDIKNINNDEKIEIENLLSQKLGARYLANNLLNKYDQIDLPMVFQEFLEVYNAYIQDTAANKISDRLMFSAAELESTNTEEVVDIKALKRYETILKYSLRVNVGSQSGSPPNSLQKDDWERSVSFYGNEEVGKLFYQSSQNDLDKLYTWRR